MRLRKKGLVNIKNYQIIILVILFVAVIITQRNFIDEAQRTTGEAIELTKQWQESYTELQEEHSQALEYIEQLEYELWESEQD